MTPWIAYDSRNEIAPPPSFTAYHSNESKMFEDDDPYTHDNVSSSSSSVISNESETHEDDDRPDNITQQLKRIKNDNDDKPSPSSSVVTSTEITIFGDDGPLPHIVIKSTISDVTIQDSNMVQNKIGIEGIHNHIHCTDESDIVYRFIGDNTTKFNNQHYRSTNKRMKENWLTL